MIGGALEASLRPVPKERSPRAREIINTARDLLEAQGRKGLTMRLLGDALGIRAPSLYKHFAGRSALEVALVEVGLDETGVALHHAVAKSGKDRVRHLLTAYRATGLANPELYRLITSSSFPRTDVLPGLETWAGEPFFLATGEPYLAQALWSFAHGTLILELDGRFALGTDLERTWLAGCEAFVTARLNSHR